jgi:hypothetical protein
MYFAYLDESGTPDYEDESELYVLTAFVINESNWILNHSALHNMKQAIWNDIKFDPNSLMIPSMPRSFEIHLKDIYGQKKEYKNISFDRRMRIIDQLIVDISKFNATIISIVINKEELKSKIDLDEWAIRLMMERLDQMSLNNNTDFIMMVYDSANLKFDNERRKIVENILDGGTLYHQKFNKIFEGPFFTKSETRNFIQCADIVGYFVRRAMHFFNTNDPMDGIKPMENIVLMRFPLLYKMFNKGRNNQISLTSDTIQNIGIKIFPKIMLQTQFWDWFEREGTIIR